MLSTDPEAALMLFSALVRYCVLLPIDRYADTSLAWLDESNRTQYESQADWECQLCWMSSEVQRLL